MILNYLICWTWLCQNTVCQVVFHIFDIFTWKLINRQITAVSQCIKYVQVYNSASVIFCKCASLLLCKEQEPRTACYFGCWVERWTSSDISQALSGRCEAVYAYWWNITNTFYTFDYCVALTIFRATYWFLVTDRGGGVSTLFSRIIC